MIVVACESGRPHSKHQLSDKNKSVRRLDELIGTIGWDIDLEAKAYYINPMKWYPGPLIQHDLVKVTDINDHVHTMFLV